jgi:hypothetical protein
VNRKIRGLVKTAASISLAGGILAAAAGPAFAAAPNEAYAAAATGLISVSPLAEATSSGTSPVTLANINVAGLVTTGIVTDKRVVDHRQRRSDPVGYRVADRHDGVLIVQLRHRH